MSHQDGAAHMASVVLGLLDDMDPTDRTPREAIVMEVCTDVMRNGTDPNEAARAALAARS